MTGYVGKETLKDCGFVRLPNGRVYKQNTLERYAAAGWLDFGREIYTALDRLSAGGRLFADFYLGGLNAVKAVDMAKIRVDGGGSVEKTSRRLFHADRYEKAVLCVPAEFWPVVRRVVVEDLPLKAEGSVLDVKRKLYAQRVDLCRGLDRLIDFYRGHGVKFSR